MQGCHADSGAFTLADASTAEIPSTQRCRLCPGTPVARIYSWSSPLPNPALSLLPYLCSHIPTFTIMSDRVWVVTGTNSGLGLAIAQYLLAQGDKVSQEPVQSWNQEY